MRVATFNVHGWTDRHGRSTAQRAIELLRTLACDAVVLQEVPEVSGTLARVAGELGMFHSYAEASFLGNALLSAAAPKSFEVIALSTALAERRSAFMARLPWEGGMFTLGQAGWVDLYRLGRDSNTAIARDGDHCEGATCWAGTRIDYLWAAPSFREHARLVVCERVLSDVSDHVPVVAEIACRG